MSRPDPTPAGPDRQPADPQEVDVTRPGPSDSAARPDTTVDLRPGTAGAASWPWRWLVFAAWYAGALVTSSRAVLHDLVTPGDQARSGIARVRTSCRTDAEVSLLAALITLTPGTLTLGTRREPGPDGAAMPDGRRVLYVHGLYADDADALRAEIHDMEARLLHAMRRTGVAR